MAEFFGVGDVELLGLRVFLLVSVAATTWNASNAVSPSIMVTVKLLLGLFVNTCRASFWESVVIGNSWRYHVLYWLNKHHSTWCFHDYTVAGVLISRRFRLNLPLLTLWRLWKWFIKATNFRGALCEKRLLGFVNEFSVLSVFTSKISLALVLF